MELKTVYKFIEFEKSVEEEIFWCINRRYEDILGEVIYNHKWKEWVFCPFEDTQFSNTCLDDISDFLGQLNS